MLIRFRWPHGSRWLAHTWSRGAEEKACITSKDLILGREVGSWNTIVQSVLCRDCLSRRLIFFVDSYLDYCFTAWRPSFTNAWLGHFTFLQGNEGRLQCKQSAAPHPTFQWFRNGILITSENSRHYDILHDGTLVIKRVDKQLDEGNFTCKAQNFLGEDSSSAIVVVNGKFPRRSYPGKRTHGNALPLPSSTITQNIMSENVSTTFPRPFSFGRQLGA